MSEKKAVFSAAVCSGLLGGCLGVNLFLKCAPEKRPLQFLARMTAVACMTQFMYARVLLRGVIYDGAQKRARKAQTKGGRFGEILSVVTHVVAWYGAGLFVFHVGAVLCGAPLFENFYGTLLWAAMVSALTFLPIGIVTDGNSPEWIFQDEFALFFFYFYHSLSVSCHFIWCCLCLLLQCCIWACQMVCGSSRSEHHHWSLGWCFCHSVGLAWAMAEVARPVHVRRIAWLLCEYYSALPLVAFGAQTSASWSEQQNHWEDPKTACWRSSNGSISAHSCWRWIRGWTKPASSQAQALRLYSLTFQSPVYHMIIHQGGDFKTKRVSITIVNEQQCFYFWSMYCICSLLVVLVLILWW